MSREEKIREIQILDQNLQNILMQKQSFEMELSETKSAAEQMEKSGDEVLKIIGNLMIKTEKSRVKEELSSKEKLLEIRINALDKQEGSLTEKLEKIRDEIIKTQK